MSARDRPSRKRTILVVDDEPGIVDVLIAVLEDAGHRALGAPHGRAALTKLGTLRPDLVLLDLEMPELDGGETLRAMKRDARHTKVAVVMMSGIPESIVKRRCRGYQAFLRKPFSLEELLGTIDRLLKSPEPSRGGARARTAPARKQKS